MPPHMRCAQHRQSCSHIQRIVMLRTRAQGRFRSGGAFGPSKRKASELAAGELRRVQVVHDPGAVGRLIVDRQRLHHDFADCVIPAAPLPTRGREDSRHVFWFARASAVETKPQALPGIKPPGPVEVRVTVGHQLHVAVPHEVDDFPVFRTTRVPQVERFVDVTERPASRTSSTDNVVAKE